MRAVDDELASRDVPPYARTMHAPRLFWEAFQWGGDLSPDHRRSAQLPGFEGDILWAKARCWYEQVYGEKLKPDGNYVSSPVRLGKTVWRMRPGIIMGTVRLFVDRNLNNLGTQIGRRGAEASTNVLRHIVGLPQGFADRLSDEELRKYFDFVVFVYAALDWRFQQLPTILLSMAQADYTESTDGVLAGRYGQARWASQQAVEKTLKGLLQLAQAPYPTAGPLAHSLLHLGKLLRQHSTIDVPEQLLLRAEASARVRYGEELSTEEQALDANHAALGVFATLARSPKARELLVSHMPLPGAAS